MTPEADTSPQGPTGSSGSSGSSGSAPPATSGPAEKPGDVWETTVQTDSSGFGWADVGLFKPSIIDVTDDQNASILDSCDLEEYAPGVTRISLRGAAKSASITIRARTTTPLT